MTSLIGALLNKAPIPYAVPQAQGRGAYGRMQQITQRADQLDSMSASATVFSIVNRTSTSTAKVGWHLHRKTGRPDDLCPLCEDCRGVVLVEKHPALSVMARPNDFYTWSELIESGQQHVDLAGEAWLVIYRIGSVPAQLWVARPDRMTVVTSPDKFLVGYIYTGPDGQEVPLRREDVMQLRMPHPKDPYRGLGPVQSVLGEVAGETMSAEYNLNFFRNGAQPGGVVNIQRGLSDAEFDQMIARWEEGHGGVQNAGRVAFLEESTYVAVKPITMADMQFVEGSSLRRDTILLAYGASKFDVGILEDVNRASAEAAKASFAERLTVPRLDRWAGLWNNDFLPQFPGADPNLEFVYANPVPADREAERQDKSSAVVNYVALIGIGVDPVEAAQVCGLPPMTVTIREPKPEPKKDEVPAA